MATALCPLVLRPHPDAILALPSIIDFGSALGNARVACKSILVRMRTPTAGAPQVRAVHAGLNIVISSAFRTLNRAGLHASGPQEDEPGLGESRLRNAERFCR